MLGRKNQINTENIKKKTIWNNMYKIMKHNLDIGKNSYLILKYKIKYNFGERRKINKDTRIYIYIYIIYWIN